MELTYHTRVAVGGRLEVTVPESLGGQEVTVVVRTNGHAGAAPERRSAFGRLESAATIRELGQAVFGEAGFQPLPIRIEPVYTLNDLPLHHRDPFDRILVAQAVAESLEFVSSDVAVDAYGVTRIW